MKKLNMFLIFLLTISIVTAVDYLTTVDKEIRVIGKDKYEVWQKTETVDVKELEKQIINLESFKNELETTNNYFDNCVDNCEFFCNEDYKREIELMETYKEKLDKSFLTDCLKTCPLICEDERNREIGNIESAIITVQGKVDEVKDVK